MKGKKRAKENDKRRINNARNEDDSAIAQGNIFPRFFFLTFLSLKGGEEEKIE